MTHTTSLEMSKKLKEAGYKQEGFWSWVYNKGRNVYEDRTYLLETDDAYNFKPDRYWVAPLASELLERLPDNLIVYKTDNSNQRYHCHRDLE